MRTDYHCHVLPAMDDGAKDVETSVGMLKMMQQQGVERVVLTPHFYAHREKSVADFLTKRQAAFEKIHAASPISDLILGAEVAVEHGISETNGIEQLAISGTNLILLELPYRPFEEWMAEEIYNIVTTYHLQVVLAHLHRYLKDYRKEQLQKMLDSRAIIQVNHEAFASFSERRFVKKLLKNEYPVVFGSDAHNLSSRMPNRDLLEKKCSADIIAKSDRMLEQYFISKKECL